MDSLKQGSSSIHTTVIAHVKRTCLPNFMRSLGLSSAQRQEKLQKANRSIVVRKVSRYFSDWAVLHSGLKAIRSKSNDLAGVFTDSGG